LEAKDVVIACLLEDVQKLLCETKKKNLVIAKQINLCRQRSHTLIVDDIQGPIDVEAHAHDTNMLVVNDVIENVVAIVTAGVLKDIHTPVCKRLSIALPRPSPTIQSLNTKGTLYSLSFLRFSMANEIHAPSKPTSKGQDPPDLNKMNQL
jgi:hypothetical protein